MQIQDFIANFKNHPVMFIGTGLSLRYLAHSYSWDALLNKIALEFNSNEEYYLDIKAECMTSNGCAFDKVATRLEQDFNKHLQENRHLIIYFLKRYVHALQHILLICKRCIQMMVKMRDGLQVGQVAHFLRKIFL